MKHILTFLALATLGIALTCSCGGSDGEDPVEKVQAPKLVSTSPSDGETEISGETVSVILTFDQNVKCPSSGHSLIKINDATVSKVSSYAASATIDATGLESGKKYTLNVPAGVISGYKDNPCEAISLSFSTKEAAKDYGRNPQTSLTNSNATSGAKKLYKFLLDNYGSKTISGAMGGTAWETSYSDYIGEQTGTYPGIVGFDYIFLNWPAKAWSGCPDYGDIAPVKDAWEKGNIIQIGWHWTVPPSQSTSDLNDYSYNTKTFGVKNALADGTWQNTIIKSQINKLAGYLKLLQDAGIPVLFRPLHEAAGDYTWGAWFWWGYDGAEAGRDLWIYLHDRLTTVYGLNNLIWVWTVQTSDAGNLATADKLEAWYPGESYVDIVGADLYVGKNTTQSAAFRLVNNSVKGKKIVALSEFGNLLDIDGFFKEDAPWGYYMNWCNFDNGTPILYSKNPDGTYGWNNTVSDWKSALSNSHCLNRGDLSNSK